MWVNRRHLLRARERLSSKRFTAMWNACVDLDPSGDLLATWIAKEELRALLGCAKTADRHTIRGPAVRLLHLVRRHRRARGAHPGRTDRDLVASGAHLPSDRSHERCDRGHQ
jgi:hypothetical protein